MIIDTAAEQDCKTFGHSFDAGKCECCGRLLTLTNVVELDGFDLPLQLRRDQPGGQRCPCRDPAVRPARPDRQGRSCLRRRQLRRAVGLPGAGMSAPARGQSVTIVDGVRGYEVHKLDCADLRQPKYRRRESDIYTLAASQDEIVADRYCDVWTDNHAPTDDMRMIADEYREGFRFLPCCSLPVHAA